MSPFSTSDVGRAARDVGRRLAAAGALLVALASLVAHAPVWLASARACVTLVVLLFTVRLGAAALELACECDRTLARAKDKVSS
jgi:hypothetical protein